MKGAHSRSSFNKCLFSTWMGERFGSCQGHAGGKAGRGADKTGEEGGPGTATQAVIGSW